MEDPFYQNLQCLLVPPSDCHDYLPNGNYYPGSKVAKSSGNKSPNLTQTCMKVCLQDTKLGLAEILDLWYFILRPSSSWSPNLTQTCMKVCLQDTKPGQVETSTGLQWTFLFLLPFAIFIYPTIYIYILLIRYYKFWYSKSCSLSSPRHNDKRPIPQGNIAKAKVSRRHWVPREVS